MIDLSIVIPTVGRLDTLDRVLRALAGQPLDGLRAELIVVDDSGSGSPLILRWNPSWPLRVLAHGRNRGRAAARNTGARAAQGKVLMFLDDDCRPLSPGFLKGHVEAHSGASCAVLGSIRIGRLSRNPWSLFLKADTEAIEGEKRQASTRGSLDARFCMTGNVSILRQTFLEVGDFREAFSRYGLEDIEWGVRLAGAGVPLRYRPDLAVEHASDLSTLSALIRKSYATGLNAVLLSNMHPGVDLSLGVDPYRLPRRTARSKSLIHLLFYPAWPPLAQALETLGWEAAAVAVCHRIAFTWRMRGILKALGPS